MATDSVHFSQNVVYTRVGEHSIQCSSPGGSSVL